MLRFSGPTPHWRAPHRAASVRKGLVVAYQGERGSNGDQAIDVHWGAGAERRGFRRFSQVIEAVLRGETTAAVLPVHNAVIGDIPDVGPMLARSPVRIVDHVEIAVMHCLLGVPGARLASLTLARSHPAALLQCSEFFRSHPAIAPHTDYDTAGAARRVARRRHRAHAAIAPAGCAARYGLEVLAEGIADLAENQTTFAVVERSGYRVIG